MATLSPVPQLICDISGSPRSTGPEISASVSGREATRSGIRRSGSVQAVPGPIVGAGLPSLILTGLFRVAEAASKVAWAFFLRTPHSVPTTDSHKVEVMRGDRVVDCNSSELGRRCSERRPVHQPFHQRAVAVSENDVTVAITVKIAGAIDMVLNAHRSDRCGRSEQLTGAVEQPHGDVAGVIAEEDVIRAVAVEVARCHNMI